MKAGQRSKEQKVSNKQVRSKNINTCTRANAPVAFLPVVVAWRGDAPKHGCVALHRELSALLKCDTCASTAGTHMCIRTALSELNDHQEPNAQHAFKAAQFRRIGWIKRQHPRKCHTPDRRAVEDAGSVLEHDLCDLWGRCREVDTAALQSDAV